MTTTPDDELRTTPDDPAVPPRTRLTGLRPLLLRLHFYAGVFVGPFILIVAFTGLLYAVAPQVDQMVYRHELSVDRIGEQRLPLADQLAAVRVAHPEGTVESIRPPVGADETTQVTLAVDDVAPDYARTVFVDPYSGEVRGALTTFGQWMPLRAWFDELHRTLHLGALGRNYSELAASWLWVISLAGLVLWYFHRRDTEKLRRLAAPDRDKKDRRRTLSWHGAVGVWLIVALLGLSVTGVTWSRYGGQSVNLLQEKLDTTAPSLDTTLVRAAGPDASTGGGDHLLFGADTALRTATDVGLSGPMWMYPPSTPEQGWQVSENKRDWPTRYDAISVDPASGAVTDRVDFADWPLPAKLTDWAIGAHMGILFGIPNQILLALTAFGLITIVLRGYRMWWQRRPTRGSAWAFGRPPLRGTLRDLHPAAVVVVVLAAVAVGWFLPLFGISLAAFVLVDLLVGAAKKSRMSQRKVDSNA